MSKEEGRGGEGGKGEERLRKLSNCLDVWWFHGIRSHHFMGNRWGNSWKQCQTLFFEAPKSLQMVTEAMKLKDAYSLEGKL